MLSVNGKKPKEPFQRTPPRLEAVQGDRRYVRSGDICRKLLRIKSAYGRRASR